MYKLLLLPVLFLFSFTAILAENDPNQWLANQKISFTENKGQIADKGKVRKDIYFMVQGKGVKVYFTKKGLIYNYIQTEETFFKKPKDKQEEDKIRKEHPEQIIRKGKAYGMELLFENASDKLTIRSEEETGETSNYYLPHCPDGITGVKSYQKITYENIYENIDLVFYSNEQGLKYDFIVKPGGKVEDIKLRYKDIDKIKLLTNGNLEITNPLGKLTENKPFSYQNNQQEIKSNYILKGRTISFQIDNYDKSRNLIIDPCIVWSVSYNQDISTTLKQDLITDNSGAIYWLGNTNSATGIAYNGFQKTFGGDADIFITKLKPTGEVIWSTYYGGSGVENCSNVAIDIHGDIYCGGYTTSTTGIASNGFQNSYGGNSDAFLVKFSNSGQRLWATYYGGNGQDYGFALVTNKDGNIYMGGQTYNTTGIASGGFQNTYGGNTDAFLVKFSSSGQRFWSTYYGGIDDDFGYALLTDTLGNVYLAGKTQNTTGIASNGFQNSYGGGNSDVFLVKFSNSGQRLWATYYGGNGEDDIVKMVNDSRDNVYIAGVTKSNTNIAYNGSQNTWGGDIDTFIVKFNDLGQRIWATYLGGAKRDNGEALAIDKDDNLYVVGGSESSEGIALGGFQNTLTGYFKVFIVKYNANGEKLWGTYYGSNLVDFALAVTLDNSNNLYISGQSDFVANRFLTKITETLQVSLAEGKTVICQDNPEAVIISSATPPGFNFIYQWYKDNKPILQANEASVTVKEAGTYFVEIRVPSGCSAFSEKRTIETLESPLLNLGEDKKICSSESVVLDAGNSGKGFSYKWSDGSIGQTLKVSEPGIYTVTVSNKICSVTDTIKVQTLSNNDLKLYNLFTPNQDPQQLNETFVIEGYSGQINLVVYNRWGKEVYRKENYQNNWSAEGLPSDIYYYHLTHQHNCFSPVNGWVQVLR